MNIFYIHYTYYTLTCFKIKVDLHAFLEEGRSQEIILPGLHGESKLKGFQGNCGNWPC